MVFPMRLVWICITMAVILLLVALVRPRRQMFTAEIPASSRDSKCVYEQTAFSSDSRVVLYYAPWCTQCTEFKPEFDKAAKQALALGMDVCFVTVNADLQGQGCISYKGATVLPTIQLEVGTDPVPPFKIYNGLRNATDLFSWVRSSLPQA